MKRILEPEVMDTPEEAIAYDDMQHLAVNEAFVADLLAAYESGDSNIELAGEVLDLGTGTARIPLLLCDKTEDVRIFGVDLSIEMMEIGRLNIEMSPHLERIMLALCDAKKLELEDARFDAVMSNSIVHHIPDPQSTFEEAVRVCKSGGRLFFRDLLRPDTSEAVDQLVETYAGDESEHAKRMFDDSLRAAFTVAEIQELISPLGFAPESVKATSDRHWTWNAVKP